MKKIVLILALVFTSAIFTSCREEGEVEEGVEEVGEGIEDAGEEID